MSIIEKAEAKPNLHYKAMSYQGPPRTEQQRMMLMLPPQFANLTPAQLEQLKNQPQFQTMMRNYLQRKQQAQRQQQVVPPQQAPQAQQIPQQALGGPRTAGQIPPQNFNMGQNTALGQPVGPAGLGAPGFANVNARNPLQQRRQTSQVAPPQVTMSALPMQDSIVAPGYQIPSEVLKKVSFPELESLHKWSDKLKAEGKEVPYDLKLYEDLISKDAEYLKRFAVQRESSKQEIETLVRDIKSYNEIKQLRMNSIALSAKNQLNNSIWGEGYQGYGNGMTNSSTKLVYPQQNRKYPSSLEVAYTDRQANELVARKLAQNPRQSLVPIRLEFESERDKFKLRDTFLWDLDEPIVRLEAFIQQLLEDYRFIPQTHYSAILASAKEQITDFQRVPDEMVGELRVPIRIDITINNTQLIDQFEWDILNYNDNDPEEFARTMCEEMELPGEFGTCISHSIREQAQLFHRALLFVGYSFDGSPINEDEIRGHLLPSLKIDSNGDDFYLILRNPNAVADYSPALLKLTQLEIERLDKEIEREARRKRRHNLTEESGTGRGSSRRGALTAARGGPSLPDLSDMPKTFRTPAPLSILPGAVDLGVPDIYTYNEVYGMKTQIRNPVPSTEPRVKYTHSGGRFIVTIKVP